MPLETAQYIHQLDSANPLGSDPIASGDDHLRLIKSAVKASFPNITGPVNLTQAQINAIPGEIDAVEASVASLSSSTASTLATKADKSTTITAGTGLTGGGDLSANRTLSIPNSGVTAGTYGSATAIPSLVINALGMITGASTNSIVLPRVGGANSTTSGSTFTAQSGNSGIILLVGIGGFIAQYGSHGSGTVNVVKGGSTLASGSAQFFEANGFNSGDKAIAIAIFNGTPNTSYNDFAITSSRTAGAQTELKYFWVGV